MHRQKLLSISSVVLVTILVAGMLSGCCASTACKVERLHTTYKALLAESNPTDETVRSIARTRLSLIDLVGEEEQRRLVGLWNDEQ